MDRLKRIIICAIILLCVGTVTLLSIGSYLILVPNSKVFGFSYASISLDEFRQDAVASDFEGITGFDKVIIKSDKASVHLVYSDSTTSNIVFFKTARYNGFSNSAELTPVCTYEIVEDDLIITYTAPKGVIIYYSNSLKIRLPETFDYNKIEFESAKGKLTYDTQFNSLFE